jgi:L-rhamnose-H+ transport protein
MSGDKPLGIILIVIAGLMQGTFMLPTKYVRKWKWENMWLSYSILAYLVLPWLIAWATVPRLSDILLQTSIRSWAVAMLFGLGWGVGALCFGLSIDYVGLALGFALILGLTASIGTLVPLFVLGGGGVETTQKSLIILGVVVMLAGIGICALAGKFKEQSAKRNEKANVQERKSYLVGLALCTLSGILSSFGNLGFAFGTEMTSVARSLNTPEPYATIPFWAVIILPLFFCNATFALYQLRKNRSFSYFKLPGTYHYHLLTASMAVLWLVGMLIYGAGGSKLGTLGPSIGWALLMSLVVLTANLWGIIAGEWRATGRKPLLTMSAGLVVLVAAMFIIGFNLK